MLERYNTIYMEAEAEVIEKKSRFIAAVKPVNSEEEARSFIESKRKEHYNATHNCFAYQVGENNEIQRFSDDGEPSGTAGRPILDVLKGEDIKNTVVVVTRYYGGTLLGTGGLVRAYGRTAKEGLIEGKIIEKVCYQMISVKVDYTLVGKVQYETLQNNHIIQDTIYAEDVQFKVLVLLSDVDSYIKSMTEATNAKAKISQEENVYGCFVDGELELTSL